MYNIPNQTKTILEIIENAGFEAYIVGGAVRDILIGRTPSDWDITTNAIPDDIEKIFGRIKGYRTEPTGKKNGTITVISYLGRQTVYYEITTYRIDGRYSDCRHPDYIRFSKNLTEDLIRRDFTINAIAMDRYGNIIDPVFGINDIKEKLIKAVGSPAARFSEDALRILRGIRLESELKEFGFKIEKTTEEAMIFQKLGLKYISEERIQNEFNRIMLSFGASDVLGKYKVIIEVIIPELEQGKGFNEKAVQGLNNIKIKYDENTDDLLSVRFAAFFSHTDNPEAILLRLKYSRRIISDTLFLIKNQKIIFNSTRIDARKKLNQFGERKLNMLISLKKAQNEHMSTDKIQSIDGFEQIVQDVIDNGDCFKLSDLAVDGNDIIALGVEEGPEIGKILKYILDGVIQGRISNNRESIIKDVKNNFD